MYAHIYMSLQQSPLSVAYDCDPVSLLRSLLSPRCRCRCMAIRPCWRTSLPWLAVPRPCLDSNHYRAPVLLLCAVLASLACLQGQKKRVHSDKRDQLRVRDSDKPVRYGAEHLPKVIMFIATAASWENSVCW